MGRKKSPEQELEQHSRNRLGILFSDWIVNSHDEEDFGFDFEIRPTQRSENEYLQASPQNFYVQVKSSEEFEGEDEVSIGLSVDYLKDDCLKLPIPVILAVYERSSDEFYWCILQEYCWDILDNSKQNWREQKYITIKLERNPLERAKERQILQQQISQVQERIAFRQYIGSARPDQSEKWHSPTPNVSSVEEVTEYKRERVEMAQKLIQNGYNEKGLSELLEIYGMPEEDQGKLDAIISLLQHREIDYPTIAVAQNKFAQEGYILAEKHDWIDALPLLDEYRDASRDYIEKYLVGARFQDNNVDENVLVLDVENFASAPYPPIWVALLQYESGEYYDETAIALVEPKFKVLESGEGKHPLSEACGESDHDFGEGTIREIDNNEKCRNCGLSQETIYQLTSQEIWRSTGEKCVSCDCVVPPNADEDNFERDVNYNIVCRDCWDSYNRQFSIPNEKIGSEFEIFCQNCRDWREEYVPENGDCPNCQSDRLMISPI